MLSLNALSGPNAFKCVVYTENHDKDDPSGGGGRLPDLIHPGQSDSWESKKRSTLAAAVVMTAPAIPMIFEGQEFLAWQPFPNGGPQPAQIDWTMATTFVGITRLYRNMIHLRRNWFNNTRGLQGANLHILPVFADNVLVYHRWDQGRAGDDVVVVCNFSNVGYPTTHFSDRNELKAEGWTGRWGYGMLWWAWDVPLYPGNIASGPWQGAFSAMGANGQYITAFPFWNLLVVHKVNIDQDESRKITEPTYMTILDMVLDAKCDKDCR